MKKSKLITGLSAAFIATMALMSCSSLIKSKSGVILTINGVPYTAEDLFNDQKTPAAAEAKFNAVYKAAVRTHFKKDHPGYSDMDEITRNTKIKISEQKSIAQSNASKNGTSYATEWKKILKDNGVDNQKGLYDKFEYDLQKEKFENKFYDGHYADLRKGNTFPGLAKDEGGFKSYIEGKQPYHMKHILVKIANLGDNNTDGTITEEEADKLYTVINDLALGTKPFWKISQENSDDDAAKKKYGSLGIMSRDTSFVDDFKLGTYFYESYYGASTISEARPAFFPGGHTKGAGLYADNIRNTVQDPTTSNPTTQEPLDYETIGVIPFDAALKLGKKTIANPTGLGDFEFKDSLLERAGILKEDFKDKYLPRNVIFNKYFNKHNIMVIAPAKSPSSDFTYGAAGNIVPEGNGSRRTIRDNYICDYDETTDFTKYTGFNRDAKNTDIIGVDQEDNPTLYNSITDTTSTPKQHVLRDDEGRIVLVFRSGSGGSSSNDDSGYQGIHFAVIQRSPFIESEADDSVGEKKTSIEEYYTEYYPGQPGGKHPHYGTDETDYKHTYANYIMNDPEVKNKKERADEVKNELKNCMPNLNTFVYQYLLKKNEINFEDKPEAIAVKDCITEWIDINREDAKIEKDHSWDNNWQNYYYSLKAKMEERKEIEVADNNIKSRVVPEYCVTAIDPTKGHTDYEQLRHLFGVGGVFHD